MPGLGSGLERDVRRERDAGGDGTVAGAYGRMVTTAGREGLFVTARWADKHEPWR